MLPNESSGFPFLFSIILFFMRRRLCLTHYKRIKKTWHIQKAQYFIPIVHKVLKKVFRPVLIFVWNSCVCCDNSHFFNLLVSCFSSPLSAIFVFYCSPFFRRAFASVRRLPPLGICVRLASESVRRSAGFAIRRKKMFDLLKPGDL